MQETNILRKIRAYIMKKTLFHAGFRRQQKGPAARAADCFKTLNWLKRKIKIL